MTVIVSPATADRWNDLVEVFGPRGDDPGWCWCQLFLRAPTEREPVAADNRAALRAEITRVAIPPGLIAYVDNHPAGWTRIGPRSDFPGVNSNKSLARVLKGDAAATWWVTCFAVSPPYRGAGVASALLRAAVEFARDHGAGAVEGHPVDVPGPRADRVAASALYTWAKAPSAAAGSVEVARTHPTRPVVRRVL